MWMMTWQAPHYSLLALSQGTTGGRREPAGRIRRGGHHCWRCAGRAPCAARRRGGAVQVVSKSVLKAPYDLSALKLNYDDLLSSFAFRRFNLRHCSAARGGDQADAEATIAELRAQLEALQEERQAQLEAREGDQAGNTSLRHLDVIHRAALCHGAIIQGDSD